MAGDNHYQILGVDISADESAIRRAYLEKAKLYHPDTSSGTKEKFEKVKNAYQELLDPKRRASYDKELGIQRGFGKSRISDEFAGYKPQAINLKVGRSANQGVFRRIFSALAGIFATRKQDTTQMPVVDNCEKISSSLNRRIDSFAIYNEESFPLSTGESLTLKPPGKLANLAECVSLLKQSFQKHPVISRAVLIEAKLNSLSDKSVFLVQIEKEISRSWGIDNLHALEIEEYAEHLPGLLLCNKGKGPFSEAVALYGIEFYPSIANTNIN
jgi:curved DNA-binding protein CbpA